MPLYPALYQVNTRVWLTELARAKARPVTLYDVPDNELDRLAAAGFDWVWLLSVWSTGPRGREVSRSSAEWRKEFTETLPDLRDDDIGGSGFAITSYQVEPALGGDAALAALRGRLQKRGLRLMLDFVPNHTALDHPWVQEHPEYYVPGTAADLDREPQNYTTLWSRGKDLILAHGRDPYFPGWSDTLQLDYGNEATQEAMTGELQTVAALCDGVRCDMAMLALPEVFERTWGRPAQPFWPRTIRRVRELHPGFCFLAEVYWDLEYTLQQQGFDYTYDKRLYDRLVAGLARPVRDHFRVPLEYQNKLVRFLENHDEPRAATRFPLEVHRAAAVITFLCPGLRFFHQGQFEGRRKRVSAHLIRAPLEPGDDCLQQFYAGLMRVLRLPQVRAGAWSLVDCAPAWEGNWSWNNFLAFWWELAGERFAVIVNFAPSRGQCYVKVPLPEVAGQTVNFREVMSAEQYERDGNELLAKGLYVDLPAWGYHILSVIRGAHTHGTQGAC